MWDLGIPGQNGKMAKSGHIDDESWYWTGLSTDGILLVCCHGQIDKHAAGTVVARPGPRDIGSGTGIDGRCIAGNRHRIPAPTQRSNHHLDHVGSSIVMPSHGEDDVDFHDHRLAADYRPRP